MPLDLDLSLDFQVFDGTRQLSFRRALETEVLDRQVIDNCVRHQVTEREAAASGGAFTSLDVVWNVPVIQLSGRPVPADLLDEELDDGSVRVWTILQSDEATLGTRWRLTSRDQVVAFNLQQLVDILSPTQRQDAAGAWTPEYFGARLGLAARIQEIDADVTEERGKRGLRRRFEITLSERVTITNDYQVRDADGVIYEVRGYTNPDRIDELMVLTCERVP